VTAVPVNGREEHGVQPSVCGRERRVWSSAFRLRQGKKSMEFSLQAAAGKEEYGVQPSGCDVHYMSLQAKA